MKLKEVPNYLLRAWQLKKIPVSVLKQRGEHTLEDVIISLTSIEARISTLHLVIRSLLSQSLPAERVILWLHSSLKPKLPPSLTCMLGETFEIRYSAEHCPHRKLVEPLRTKDLASKTIVTCDDDMMYGRDWLARLIKAHREHPNDIVAHECRKLLKDDNDEVLPYSKWIKEQPGESYRDTISIGYGGVLYPSNCLPKQTTDLTAYMNCAPRADDLWFKAMSMKMGIAIRRTADCEPMPIPILGSQRVALKRANIKEDENRAQWLAIAETLNIRP